MLVEVPLGDRAHAYGLTLAEPLMAFFDVVSSEHRQLDEVLRRPVLFRIWVMNQAVTSGRWRVLGRAGVPKDLERPPAFFKRDDISGKVSIYQDGQERPATVEQCRGLEAAAVWDPEHVEDRLRDHFAGRPNKWVQQLSLDGRR